MITIRLPFLLCLCLLPCSAVHAQTPGSPERKTALVKGSLAGKATGSALSDVQVTIPYLRLLTVSAGSGEFFFNGVAYGTQTIIVGGGPEGADTFQVYVNAPVVVLTPFRVGINTAITSPSREAIPTIALEENNLSGEDDGIHTANVSGLLTASRDPFLNAIAFTFGPYRYQARGYERNTQQVFINAIPMNDAETNDAYWGVWGGLNDVFRSRSNTYGLQASEYGFGGVNGLVSFDATALDQRKQTRFTYSNTNRNYRQRLALTHSSGILKSGWAYAASCSKRWAKEGYIAGTFYDAYSFYGAVSKKLGEKHELNLIAFGASTRRGKSAPAVQEVYDLAGSNYYNSAWGYQSGKKRNAKTSSGFQPVAILNYEYHPSSKTHWTVAGAYQAGENSNSTLDWYNARDPRPDYYRYLPSYFTLPQSSGNPDDAEFNFRKQIDWDRLYAVNAGNSETVYNVDGIPGKSVAGRRSIYAVGADVDDLRKSTFNTNIMHALTEHISLEGGFTYISQHTESYKEMLDLLGGDFFLNLNQFAVQQNVPDVDFNQYDLDHPNRLIRVGDKYNYDYINRYTRAWGWAQLTATYRRIDLFISGNAGRAMFSREGLYRNGLFEQISFGRSEEQQFTLFGAKAGITYKINGRNYLFVNALYAQDAPSVDNTFISARTRNVVIEGLAEQKTRSVEGGYLLRAPKYNARLVGFYSAITDGVEMKRFYNDDPAYQTFVNYAMQNVGMCFTGAEMALEAKLSPALSVTGVASVFQALYSSNPRVSIYLDNDTILTPAPRKVFTRNYYMAAGPQSAYTLGAYYRGRGFWNAGVNLNFFDRNYVDVNPDRRTAEAAELIPAGSALHSEIFAQEKLPAAFTMDLSFFKSFKADKFWRGFSRNTFFYLSVGITNALNNTKIRTGGFEQLRYDFTGDNPSKFPPKYFYSFGANYFLNISVKF